MSLPSFSRMPESQHMVTEVCASNPKRTDLLCVECGWEGCAELPDAPWVVFQTHLCRLHVHSVSIGW